MDFKPALRRLIDDLEISLTDGDSLSRISDEYGPGTAAVVRRARRLAAKGGTLQAMGRVLGDLDDLLTDGDPPKRLLAEGHGKSFVTSIRLARLAARRFARA